MAFVSASDILGANTARRLASDIVISTDKQNVNGGVGYAFRIGIANRVAKEARFLVGDTVDVLVDAEGRRCLIKRDPKGRWSLHTNKNVKAGRSRMLIKITYRVGMPSAASTTGIDDYEITPEGIILNMPACVSFTKNMRLAPEAGSVDSLRLAHGQ